MWSALKNILIRLLTEKRGKQAGNHLGAGRINGRRSAGEGENRSGEDNTRTVFFDGGMNICPGHDCPDIKKIKSG